MKIPFQTVVILIYKIEKKGEYAYFSTSELK